MPYKDPENKKEYARQWRQRNLAKEKARLADRVKTPEYKKYQSEYRQANRNKAKAYTKAWQKTDHGKNKMLLNRYGITLEQYNQMLEKQLHACAICKEPESQISWGKTKRLAVDHDHKTGKVRGLLCQRCNTTLGRYEDDLYVWENFIAYLSSFEVE